MTGGSGEQTAQTITVRRDGSNLSGHVLALIREVDPAMALRIGEGNAARPWAVRPDDDLAHVTAFGAATARTILDGAGARGELVRVGPPVSPEDLLADEGGRALLTTITPVQFRTPEDRRTRERYPILFPDPERFVQDALIRWDALGWPDIDEPHTNRIGGWVEECWRESLRSGGHEFAGFGAILMLDLRALSDADRVTAWGLLRFSELAGVGSRTAHGMGAVRVERR